MSERTAVYRLYDRRGALLYIGISAKLRPRYSAHKASKHWWPRVTRREETWFDSEDDARAEERRAVLAEQPEFNIRLKRGGDTPIRKFRIGDPMSDEVSRIAAETGRTNTAVVKDALSRYFASQRRKRSSRPPAES